MFRSAALAFGPRVIGVLLTGNLDDGTAGMRAINRGGGIAVVQDPEEATFPSMPQSAIQHATIDRGVRLQDVASVVTELASEPIVDGEHLPMADDVSENAFAAGDLDAMSDPEHHPGRVSAFGCPECGGVLWELKDGEFTRFRCRVGHAWTGTALLSRQADMVDNAMWTALRILEESADLSRQIAARHRARGADDLAKRFDERAESREERAAVIRASLIERSTVSDAEAPGPRRAS